ncbi:unnamed protein product [Periconia digitata]|uniref:Uncharacterized protein n=1 Tax=Periconia digitata TaxID=1303443 RepID=A0A9W4U9M6_9PLEO|nr:unnamed protein product [Periconia digitata]
MAPPAKRLRIMQSVEVDEADPDYLAARAKATAKLKNKFESIFAKYEAMPEAMTDEINMRTGEIVVDRGHLRKLDREYCSRRKQGVLDGWIADQLADEVGDDGDEEESDLDSRDELAPSLSPEPRMQKRRRETKPAAKEMETTTPRQPTQPIDLEPNSVHVNSTKATVPVTTFPNPVADWAESVQFPQTPEGQLAQHTFMMQITEAFQKAVAPIISNLVTNTPGVLPQKTTPLQTPIERAMENQDTPVIQCTPPKLPPLQISGITLHSSSSPVPERSRVFHCATRTAPIRRPRSNHDSNVLADKDYGITSPGVLDPPREIRKLSPELPSSLIQPSKFPDELHHLLTPTSIEQNNTAYEDGETEVESNLHELFASGGHFDDDERDLLSIADGRDSTADLTQYSTGHCDPREQEPIRNAEEVILSSIESETHEPQISPQVASPVTVKRPPFSTPNKKIPVSSFPQSANESKPQRSLPKFQLESDSDPESNFSDLRFADLSDTPLSKRKLKQTSSPPPLYKRRSRGRPPKNRANGDTPQQSSSISLDSLHPTLINGDTLSSTPARTTCIKCESKTPPSLSLLPSSPRLSTITPTVTNTAAPHPTPQHTMPLSAVLRHPVPTASTPRSAPQLRNTIAFPSTPSVSSATTNKVNIESQTKLPRSVYSRRVRKQWAAQGRRRKSPSSWRSGVGANGGGTAYGGSPAAAAAAAVVVQSIEGDEDSEDELAA